jgi:hypothetical protein
MIVYLCGEEGCCPSVSGNVARRNDEIILDGLKK